MKLDLTKLVFSGNIPVGFRELTAEETRKPGDIYGDSYTGVWREVKNSLCTSPYGKKNAAGKSENGWLPHFRRIENPPGIPATHGQVTAGFCVLGDLQRMDGSGTVYGILGNDAKISDFSASKIYRLQPAFVVENTIKRGVACYRGITIPPGFRELDQDEYRCPGTDAIWLPACCKDQPPHIWDFNPSYSGPYDSNCNPTIRRTEPVSDKAPLLPGEKVENVDIGTEDFTVFSTFTLPAHGVRWDSVSAGHGHWKRSYESACADLTRVGEKSEKRRQRIEQQEQEIVGLKSSIQQKEKQIVNQVESITKQHETITKQSATIASFQKQVEALQQDIAAKETRNQNLWKANADLLKRIEQQADMNLTVAVLRDQKKLLELKLKECETIAEQRHLRIADLECSLLKIKQEVANAKLNEPVPAQPFARNPFAYREIYDNDLLKDGDELTEDGLAWRTFYCGPKARATFGDFRNHYPKLFRARRKL